MIKTTAVLLITAMVLTSLISCGTTQNPDNSMPGEQGAVTTMSDDSNTAGEDSRPMHSIPASADYEGVVFNIMYPEWQGYKYYFFADEATGDAMNDAIYSRTINVEEYLNVDIMQYSPGYIETIYPELKQSVTAQDDAYHLVLTHCIRDLGVMVTDGLLFNYDNLPNVDYNAEWWNREMMDVLRLGTNTYFGVSDYMIPCPYGIFFSKNLIDEFNMNNPYELVYSNEWTLDKFMEMAVSVVTDKNGDGVISDGDIFGICCDESSKYISFMTGCNQFMTSRDSDNRIVLGMNTEKMYDLAERFYALANTDGVTVPEGTMSLMDSQLLFELRTIADAVLFRDTDVDIGILPYPKYDAEQENYISLDWGGLMGIPGSIQNPEMVGSVLELLAYESGNEVIPTYYDVLLDGKLARDEDTIAMLDIIFDTIAYEVGGNYFGFNSALGDLFYTIPRLVIEQKKQNFASEYQAREKSANAAIKTFYKALDNMEGTGK